jgi:hypothetical protein
MNRTNEVARVLRQVADTVEVPPLNEAALHRQVRRERGRRSRSGIAAAAAAAAMIGVGLAGADHWFQPGGQQAPAATAPAEANASVPVYLRVGGRLAALTPDGELHRLGVRVEEVLGATGDGVMAVGQESNLVRFRAVRSEGEWRFDRVEAPTGEPVQGAAVSQTPSRVAWLSLDDEVVTYDLEAGAVVARAEATESTSVQAVSSGVLVHDDAGLRLLGDEGASVELPVEQIPWYASVAGGLVAVADGQEDSTTVFDVSEGRAQVVDRIEGSGILGPAGSGLLSLLPGERDGAALAWTGDGEARPVSGLEGVAVDVSWAGPDTAVVLVRDGDGGTRTDVFTCSVADAACGLALRGGRQEISLRW